ncbi:MAG: hypothetical protein ACD_79C00186G0002, partial [uncultured bacterium]
YPLIVTGFSQIIFPFKANGSLFKIGSDIRGSLFIGQVFSDDKFFHGRPSVSSYDPLKSAGSNLSITSDLLNKTLEKRKNDWKIRNGDSDIPWEMLYSSASGLDPDISLNSALLQVDRIVNARKLNAAQKQALINYINITSQLNFAGFIYKSPLNVIKLNLKLVTA